MENGYGARFRQGDPCRQCIPTPAGLSTNMLLSFIEKKYCPLTRYFPFIHNVVRSLTNGGSFLYAQCHISSTDLNYFIASFRARQFVLLNFCYMYYTLILSVPVPKTNLDKLHGTSPSQELTLAQLCTEISSVCSPDTVNDPYSESNEFSSKHSFSIIVCFNIILRPVSRSC